MMMKGMVFLLFMCASLAYAEPTEPSMTVELDKPGDAAEILYEAETTVVSITSWSGIGGAKLVLGEGPWPEPLVIRLNLSNLESFGITNGVIRTHTSLKSPRRVPYWKVDGNPDRAAGVLECGVTKEESVIEVVVPKELMDGSPEEIRLSWIDAFRG